MKTLITILFICLLQNTFATTYYVSNAGSDSNNGLTTGASWQHISKVNSTATTGDSIFFNRGDSWNEQIIPAANNIYYGSYGTGAKPIITGFQNQSGWTNIGGNLWRTIAGNAVSNLNMAGLTIYCSDCTATDASTGVTQTWNGTSWKNYW